MLENLLISIFLFLSVPGLFMTKNTQHVRFRFYFSFNILLVSFLPTVQLSISFKMKCLWLKTSYFLFHLLAFYNEGVWRSGHMKLLISEFPIKRVCKLCQAILSGVAKTFLKKNMFRVLWRRNWFYRHSQSSRICTRYKVLIL